MFLIKQNIIFQEKVIKQHLEKDNLLLESYYFV